MREIAKTLRPALCRAITVASSFDNLFAAECLRKSELLDPTNLTVNLLQVTADAYGPAVHPADFADGREWTDTLLELESIQARVHLRERNEDLRRRQNLPVYV
jgi:hypothetical protein